MTWGAFQRPVDRMTARKHDRRSMEPAYMTVDEIAMPGSAKVDPACAKCRAPATMNCGCEAAALEVAMNDAEKAYFSKNHKEIRSWVRRRSRDYILAYFHIISEPCKDAYSEHLDIIKATCMARYGGPPTPAHYARAHHEYRHNIDRAWSAAVMRYPEVLGYFFSLVHLSLPDDEDPAVEGPPFDRLGDWRYAERRTLVPQEHAPTPKFPIPAALPAPPPPHLRTPPVSPQHARHQWEPNW